MSPLRILVTWFNENAANLTLAAHWPPHIAWSFKVSRLRWWSEKLEARVARGLF